jgi:hypothetical protein
MLQITIANTKDYIISLIPGNLKPTINVQTQRNGLGGWVTVTGRGFTPKSGVQIFASGLAGRTVPLAIAVTSTDVNGNLNPSIMQQDFWTGQQNWPTIRAVDDFGLSATGTTVAYRC